MELNDQNFEEVIHGDSQPVLIEFWADWCGPCRMMAPTIERIKAEYSNQLLVGKVNVDNEPDLIERHRISSIPTVFIMRDGELLDRLVGARPYDDLESIVKKYLE